MAIASSMLSCRIASAVLSCHILCVRCAELSRNAAQASTERKQFFTLGDSVLDPVRLDASPAPGLDARALGS